MKWSFWLGSYLAIRDAMRSKGNRYEELAAEYLLAQGYAVLAKNVNYRFGEIDLVAFQKPGLLVFIEVRERGDGSWIRPEETISPAKERRLRMAIQSYLAQYRGPATEARIDLIGFDGERLVHLKDFFPMGC